MRLIHAKTRKLENFADERQIPPYAILSHTWTDREVLHKDLVDSIVGSENPDLDWQKIHMSCRQAIADSIDYIWIDTCCIDKTSSAELSEGINSMFRWYENALVCYAYLSDVCGHVDPSSKDNEFHPARVPLESIIDWGKRGWVHRVEKHRLRITIEPASVGTNAKGWAVILGLPEYRNENRDIPTIISTHSFYQ